MNLKRINNADKHAVFGSIEVLGDITGSGIQTIRKNIDALSKSVSTTAAKQDSYWKAIADDSLISPIEKRTLKQEWNTIEQTYASLMTLARENGVEESTEIVNYSLAYNALYAYLTQTLKVFDDMGVATPVADREVFEKKFEDYYENQTFAQNKVVVKQHLNIRELENLNGPGTENEIASYKGMLYMYDTSAHQWKPLDAASYIGAIADNMNFPTAGNGNYFLAIGNRLKTRLFANGVPLLANGSELIINKEVTGGNIYVCDESGNWIEVTDRDNWCYIVAMNDLIKYNFAVSTQFGHYISGQIETKIANATPKYKGPYNSLAQIPECNNGDWFTWAGETTRWDYSEDYFINLEYGQVYKYNKPTWAKLDPTDSRYNNEFMTALIDIVNMNAQGDGYFSTIFAKKIFALEAAIQTLQTKVIELSENGSIQSLNYTAGANSGFKLGADGIGRFNKLEVYGEINFQRGANFDEGLLLLPLKLPESIPQNKKGYIWIE
jgi:hypothetical protein